MMSFAISLHMLAAVVWVGGMFFAYMALRPAALELEPPVRLALWSRAFAKFFPWVWVCIFILPLSGYWMILVNFDGFKNVGLYVHLMTGLGWLMIFIFLYVFFVAYRGLNQALSQSDYTLAGQYLARIRQLVGINLLLGLGTILLASAGAYWLA